MKAKEIIEKALQEVLWAKARLAAVGYPGVAEVEQAIDRAVSHLREKVDEETASGSGQTTATESLKEAGEDLKDAAEHVGDFFERLGSVAKELHDKADEELAEIAEKIGVKNWKNIKKKEHLVKAIMGQAGYAVPPAEPPAVDPAAIPDTPPVEPPTA